MSGFRFGFTGGFSSKDDIKNSGADFHELNLGGISELSDDEIDSLAAEAKEKGYSYEAANRMFPGEYKITVDNPDYEKADAYLDSALSKAKKLGIKIVVMGSSGARNFPEGVSYETAFGRLVFFLKNHVAPLCEKHGIICALENLSYGESNILNKIEESLKIVEEVDSPFIKILVDFYHFGFNKDSYDSLRKAKEHIIHIHVASVLNKRQYPAPDDGEDYSVLVNFLREIGYDKREARISFEARTPEGKTFPESAADSLRAFKNL